MFYVLYAWSITCVMDPENVYKWHDRVGKYLDQLLDENCLWEAYAEAKNTYIVDILGEG